MKKTKEVGPIYGVELIESLPLDGGSMEQAMPSRRDLDDVFKRSQRTVAGYEVLLEHYRRAMAELDAVKEELEKEKADGAAQSELIQHEWASPYELAGLKCEIERLTAVKGCANEGNKFCAGYKTPQPHKQMELT